MRICGLNNWGRLVRILVYRGVVVQSLGIGCVLASRVYSKAALVYKMSLVEWVKYKASNYIEFGRGKEFLSFLVLV